MGKPRASRVGREMVLAALCGLLAALPPRLPAQALHSYALVQDDATLQLRGKTVRLYGIYIPPSGRTCRTTIEPVRCASRAALALDFKIQGFVYCEPKQRYRDRSLSAVCFVGRTNLSEGIDLGAYLIEKGWAVARPEAPFEYHVLEDIARTRQLGVWGYQADVIDRRR